MNEQQPKLLIVDDRPENLVAMERVLRKLDTEIFKADSGNAALSLTLRHDFALVLLDVQMPIMDGFEVASLMHDNEATRHVPIIFVTAINKDEAHEFRGYQAGAVDYLFKPVNPDILTSKVHVFLELYRQKQALDVMDELKRSQAELQREIAERNRSEAQLREREEQLRQSQKMEAVGVLAGGVAHEFNNLLQAIGGYAKFAMDSLVPDEQPYQDLVEIVKATKRATTLTRGLLGFSRQGVIQPQHIKPNDLIADALTDVGYNVLVAKDGEEAVRVFEENSDAVHLALLDVVMPKMNGHDVLERIKLSNPEIRVLFCSGYDPDATQTAFPAVERQRFIQKPVDSDALLSIVREELDKDAESSALQTTA